MRRRKTVRTVGSRRATTRRNAIDPYDIFKQGFMKPGKRRKVSEYAAFDNSGQFLSVHTTKANAQSEARKHNGYVEHWTEDKNGNRVRTKLRGNPSDKAAELYESWTGEPSQHETVVTDRIHDHSHLTDLARLVAFKLRGVSGQLKFPDKLTRLCSNETGTQLYIRGGDQSIDLDDFNTVTRHPVDPTKESVVLGEIDYLYYSARKPFLGGPHTSTGTYKHKLGEETGNRPVLLYDTRSHLLSIAGGSYYIKPGDYDGKHSRGIVD